METQTKICEEIDCFVNRDKTEQERCVMCRRNRDNRDAQIKFPDNFMTSLQRYGF